VPETITVEEARRRVLMAVSPLETEDVKLRDALGRVVAESVRSAAHVPPFDNSAMDGFAVCPGAQGELRVIGEARAGSPSAVALTTGTAVSISTGAMVPEGTGSVVPVERCSPVGSEELPASVPRQGASPERVRVPQLPDGANVRRRGEDVRAGDLLLEVGAVLGPAALGVLASLGRSSVRCARRPRVAIIATGDELVEPGHELGAGQIWSSNPPALAGQVALAGGETNRLETVGDDPAATRDRLEAALGVADVICVSGGVSVGAHDHVKGALAALGVEESFWGVALRPGKPTWFGTREHAGRPVLCFGLPGNPVSAMVTFQLFVRPALRALQGADPAAPRPLATLGEEIGLHPQREQAVRCRLRIEADGVRAIPTGPQGSHVMTSMLAAEALALVAPGEGALAAGERVEIELLA